MEMLSHSTELGECPDRYLHVPLLSELTWVVFHCMLKTACKVPLGSQWALRVCCDPSSSQGVGGRQIAKAGVILSPAELGRMGTGCSVLLPVPDYVQHISLGRASVSLCHSGGPLPLPALGVMGLWERQTLPLFLCSGAHGQGVLARAVPGQRGHGCAWVTELCGMPGEEQVQLGP